MALKLSTGLVNFLMSGRSMRKAFDDAVLNIYSGAIPTNAEDAATGVLLATITKSSGSVASTDRGTPRLYNILIGGTFQAGSILPVDINIDGATTTYPYTVVAGDTDIKGVATSVARMLNDVSGVHAIADGATGYLYVQAEINGLALTVSDHTGGTGNTTFGVNSVTTVNRPNTLQLGKPTLGVIGKNTDVWSGVALASGTAGYFRFERPDFTANASDSALRIQGAISTSGAELNLSNINFVKNATQTCDTFTLTQPEAAA